MKKNEREQSLWRLVEPAVEALGMSLVDLELKGSGGHAVLRVLLDTPEGIKLEECARASRTLSDLLDLSDPIPGRYTLEVGSPGVNRPLVLPAHFRAAVGQRVRVRMERPVVDKTKNFLGELLRFIEDGPAIELKMDDKSVVLPIDQMVKANIDFPFEAPRPKK